MAVIRHLRATIHAVFTVARIAVLSWRTGIAFESLMNAHLAGRQAYVQVMLLYLQQTEAEKQAVAEVETFLAERAADVN